MVDTPGVIKYVVPKEYQPDHPVVEKKEKVVDDLVLYPDTVLRDVAEPVRDPLAAYHHVILKRMNRVLKETKGLGLAAPQIGITKRIIIVETDQGLITLFNPEIVDRSGMQIDTESCLSLPGIEVSIKRASKVTVRGFDFGRKEEVEIVTSDELTAACFQHELDHLNGVLILDYASRQQRRAYKRKLNKK